MDKDSIPARIVALENDDESIPDYCARTPLAATPLSFFGQLFVYCKDMNARNVERNERLSALERRVTELESRPAVKWQGVFAEGRKYAAGDLVQKSGLWLCLGSTVAKPGTDHDAWRLLVKQTDPRGDWR